MPRAWRSRRTSCPRPSEAVRGGGGLPGPPSGRPVWVGGVVDVFRRASGVSLTIGSGINPRDPAGSDRNAPASISARCMEAPGSGKNFPRHDFAGVRHRAVGGSSPRIGAVLPELSARFHRRRLAVTAHCGRMISAAEPRPRSPCTASRDRRCGVYSRVQRLQSKSSRNARDRALARERSRDPAAPLARRPATCRTERRRDRAVRS
jgi:hypothetical protein